MLTLLALILAIGIVVDDAIVVLENIQRRVEHGEHPLVAGVLGTRQVTFAVIATSITLIAVFVPISFLEGNVEHQDRQHGQRGRGARDHGRQRPPGQHRHWAPSTSSPSFFMPEHFAFDAGEALHQRDVAERVGGALGDVAVVALDLALQRLALA